MHPEIDSLDLADLQQRVGDTSVDQPLFRVSRNLLGAVAERLLRAGAAPEDVKSLLSTLTDSIVEQTVQSMVAAAAAAAAASEPAPSAEPVKLRVIAKPALRIVSSQQQQP